MNEILERLYGYSKFGIKLGLENMKKLMAELGNPQESYKKIHIAGTNGKGSTASMIENVLIEAGYNVGKYSSPHLVRFNERIVFNREEISDKEIIDIFLKVEDAVKKAGLTPTFFEITTAMMFLYYKIKGADYAVIETGMGGRYDATNIIIPEVSVITNVTMDHTSYLGDTVEKIGEEKAGIIKSGVPLVFGEKKEAIKEIFRKKADKYIDALSDINYVSRTDNKNYTNLVIIENIEYEIPLYGKHQIENFMTAYSVLKLLKVESEIIKRGIKKCIWEGRFEIISKNPFVVLDGAHNEDAALRLKENMLNLFKKSEIVLLVSVLKDKDLEKIFKIFAEFADETVFTSLSEYERGSSAEELYIKYGKKFLKSSAYESADKAYEYAKSTGKSVVIAGSLYLAGKFKKEVF